MAPGDYVLIEVIDNGSGMDEETLARSSNPSSRPNASASAAASASR